MRQRICAQWGTVQRKKVFYSVALLCFAYSISVFLPGDMQKTQSVLTSTNMMPLMSSFVVNHVYSSLKTSFVDFTTSISPSSTNHVPPGTSSSQIYSSLIQTTLANDTGILTCISSVNTIYYVYIWPQDRQVFNRIKLC
jgi:hypothetical protein